jgi:hypothetical protein
MAAPRLTVLPGAPMLYNTLTCECPRSVATPSAAYSAAAMTRTTLTGTHFIATEERRGHQRGIRDRARDDTVFLALLLARKQTRL